MVSALDNLKSNMESSHYNKEKPDGFLTSDLSEYYSCIELNLEKLATLYAKDKTHWSQILFGIKSNVATVQETCKKGFVSFRTYAEELMANQMFEEQKDDEPGEKIELKGVKKKLLDSSKQFQMNFMDHMEALP